jgi:hypothetical protein
MIPQMFIYWLKSNNNCNSGDCGKCRHQMKLSSRRNRSNKKKQIKLRIG